MKSNVLKDIQDKFEAHNAAVQATKMALEAAQAKFDEAKAEMETASDEDDVTAFAVAKDAAKEAENAIEMAKMRLDRLESKGAVSKEEATAACNHYRQRLQEIDVEAAKKVTAHIDEIVAIEKTSYSECLSTAKEYSDLLRILGLASEIHGETGIPSQLHFILGGNICLIQDSNFCGSNKKRLYALARSGK